MSAVPPIRSEAAPLLLDGELGCGFRHLASREVGGSFLSQSLARVEDAAPEFGFPVGELGCDFRSLCSPHSVP